MLKKKFILVLIIIIFSIYVVGAIVDYFEFKSVRTSYSKKVIFEFDFSASFDAATIGPGESVYINPYITNNSTELMYVFIRVDMPFIEGDPLYTINVNDDWSLIEQKEGVLVYAYASPNMYVLSPGENTSILANKMTMKNISVVDYSSIEDINVTFTAYAMACNNVGDDPNEAWNIMKELCNID